MTRIIGFFLVQLAALLYGRGHILEHFRQTGALRSYCDMLEQLQGLLESDGSPMPALFALLSERSSDEAGAFIKQLTRDMDKLGEQRFQNLWDRALSENSDFLDEEAKRDIETLGAVLGRYDNATQLEAINLCREHLRRRLEQRQQTQIQDTRLTLAISASLGLFVGILLI